MRFWKWHALGNSYVLMERAALGGPLDQELARRLCDSRRGIGSDGVLEVIAAENARRGRWRSGTRTARSRSSRGTGAGSPRPGSRGVKDAAEVTIDVGGRSLPGRSPRGRPHRDGGGQRRGRGDRDGRAGRRTHRANGRLRGQPTRGRPRRAAPGDAPPDRASPRDARPGFPTERTCSSSASTGRTRSRWRSGSGERVRLSASGSSAVAVAAAAITNGWCESPVTVTYARRRPARGAGRGEPDHARRPSRGDLRGGATALRSSSPSSSASLLRRGGELVAQVLGLDPVV